MADKYEPRLKTLYNTTIRDALREQFGYATCPADDANTSVVTVCGLVFSQVLISADI